MARPTRQGLASELGRGIKALMLLMIDGAIDFSVAVPAFLAAAG